MLYLCPRTGENLVFVSLDGRDLALIAALRAAWIVQVHYIALISPRDPVSNPSYYTIYDNITHFAPSYPKIFSGERGTVLTYRFEKLMFEVLSVYKNSMKKFNGCLVTAIQKNFRIKKFFSS